MTLNAPYWSPRLMHFLAAFALDGCCLHLLLSAGVTAVDVESGELGLPGTSVTSNDLTRLCIQVFSRSAST